MTREQIAEGQRLARNFKPRQLPPAGGSLSNTEIAQTRPESSGIGERSSGCSRQISFMAPERTMKTFSLHWGSGVVEEEAQIETPYHRPTIQLLKFTEGKAKGSYELRFCTYDHRGRFQRMPLIVDARELAPLRKALKRTPKLRKLLAQLLA